MLQKIRKLKRKLTSRNSLNNSYLNELVSSIHRADIKATIFSIFWAAGPVTVIANLTDNVKNNKIAYEILCKSHPTSKEIFYAFNMHFDTEVAEFAEIIHLHKENGFPIDSQANRRKIIKYYKKIDTKDDIPDVLRVKFFKALKGDYASIKKGVERKVGFLSKIYHSSGQQGLYDLDDANNAIAFFIELLSGRRIYYYKAISKFDDAKKDYLFKTIESLRGKITQKYNHIQGIYKQVFLTVSEMSPNLDLCEIVNVSEDLTYNLNLLDESLKEIRVKSLDKSIKKQVQLSKNRFHQNLRIINTLLKRLDLLLKQWHSLSFNDTEQINNQNVEYELAYVQLEEKSRMAIAYDMETYLNYDSEFGSSVEMVKSFAYQAFKIIQKPISLDKPSILTAIELSSGANLSSIKINNSTKQKLDVTYNLCRSVKTDIKEIRQRVKKVVLAQYS